VRITVMGAGAVGAYLGGLLARAGHDVTLVARGEHLRTLQEQGLRVRSHYGDFTLRLPALADPAAAAPADLVLFMVKSQDTEPAARQLLSSLAPVTAVLSLQNGVEHLDLLAAALGRERLLAGVIYIEATLAAPGEVHQLGPLRRIRFGEVAGGPSERAQRILAALTEAGLDTELVKDVRRALWEKFVSLASMASITAAADATMGDIFATPAARDLFEAAVREAAAVAAADGVAISESQLQRILTALVDLPAMKSSLQRDLQRGHPLELEYLSGSVVRLGERYGVPTPLHRTLYALVRLVETRRRRVAGGGEEGQPWR